MTCDLAVMICDLAVTTCHLADESDHLGLAPEIIQNTGILKSYYWIG